MIKLLATDLDGTLLNSKKELPPGLFPMIRRMDPTRFAAASGRQYYNLQRLFAPVKDEILIIAENGALILENGRIIHRDMLAPEDALFMLRKAKQVPEAYPILCGEHCAYIEEGPGELMEQVHRAYDQVETVPNLEDLVRKDNICKLAVHSIPKNAEFDVFPVLNQYKGNFDVLLSGRTSIDVMNKGVNKGKAIRVLKARYHLTERECMAFGDYLNDYEMLQECYYSYTMENAHPRLKAISRFQAPSNEEFGVQQVMRETFHL